MLAHEGERDGREERRASDLGRDRLAHSLLVAACGGGLRGRAQSVTADTGWQDRIHSLPYQRSVAKHDVHHHDREEKTAGEEGRVGVGVSLSSSSRARPSGSRHLALITGSLFAEACWNTFFSARVPAAG